MTLLKNSILLLFLVVVVSSCGSKIDFNPDFHKNSHELQGIVSERGEFIACSEERFSHFYSMSEEKVLELWALIEQAGKDNPRLLRNKSYQNMKKQFRDSMIHSFLHSQMKIIGRQTTSEN